MKLVVREQAEDVVEISLKQHGDSIRVLATKKRVGRTEDIGWVMCDIKPEGLYRFAGFPSVLGISVDSRGRVAIVNKP